MTASRALAATTLLAVLSPAAVQAQTPEFDHAVLELPSSTAAMAMGGAFDLFGEESDAVFYNPAALGRAEGFVLGLQRFRDAAGQLTLSAATEWFDGRVGVGLQALEWGAEPARARSGGVGRILEDGPVAVAEWAATAGYAREALGVTLGAAAKLLGHRRGTERDLLAAVDLGVTREVGPLRLGLAARNLAGEGLAGDAAGRVPRALELGAGMERVELGPLDVGSAGRITLRDDGEVEAGAGAEVAYWPVVGRTFIGRVGVQRATYAGDASRFTFGAAFHGDALVLEYAYRPADLLGGDEGLHRLSVGWR